MKKIFIFMFLIILFSPIALSVIHLATGMDCDVILNGYTDTIQKPKCSLSSYWSGEYQHSFSNWVEQRMKPRGALVKTYSTLEYYLFNQGNRIIGKNRDIFEAAYIDAELCTNGFANYLIDDNTLKMKEFVDKLQTLQDLLSSHNKSLFYYVAPGKAFAHFDNIPNKYINMAPTHRKTAVECFSEYIKKTNIPYLVCRDMIDQLEYPSYYSTGIHWSRPYEQMISSIIVDKLKEVTNKRYRGIRLGQIGSDKQPFWRDSDVYDLLNIWPRDYNETTFYEYEEMMETIDEYDNLDILIVGDSFAEGLRHDIKMIYPLSSIINVNRKNFYTDKNDQTHLFSSWKDVDFVSLLGEADVVIIEATEPELENYSWGFVDFLIEYLSENTKLPKKTYPYMLDGNIDDAWNTDAMMGIYWRENGYTWAGKQCRVILDNPDIYMKGIEIELRVPDLAFLQDNAPDILSIYINGKRIFTKEYNEEWHGNITFDPLEIKRSDSSIIDIEIFSSKSFIPKELGINEDLRELGFQLMYVGKVR